MLKNILNSRKVILLILLAPILGCLVVRMLNSEYLERFHMDYSFHAIAFIIFIAPVLEELVFRGLFQEILLKILKRKAIAFVAVNILFTVLHYHIRSEYEYLLVVFISGLIYSIVRDRYGLKNAIYLHIYYNIIYLVFV